MAVNAYLFIDGVEGPSTSKENHIDVLSFDWSVNQETTYGEGNSGHESKAGCAELGKLNVTKVLDKTSPILADHCASGDILKEVYILYDKPTGGGQDDYYRIYLKNALITQVIVQGNREALSESVSFAYDAIEYAYRPEKADKTLDAAITKGFDISTLTPGFAAPKALGKIGKK
jgi:type VI secretion system secreted protein Hcp